MILIFGIIILEEKTRRYGKCMNTQAKKRGVNRVLKKLMSYFDTFTKCTVFLIKMVL